MVRDKTLQYCACLICVTGFVCSEIDVAFHFVFAKFVWVAGGSFLPCFFAWITFSAIKAVWHHYALHRHTLGLKKLNLVCNSSFLSTEFIEVMFIFTVTCSTSSRLWHILNISVYWMWLRRITNLFPEDNRLKWVAFECKYIIVSSSYWKMLWNVSSPRLCITEYKKVIAFRFSVLVSLVLRCLKYMCCADLSAVRPDLCSQCFSAAPAFIFI